MVLSLIQNVALLVALVVVLQLISRRLGNQGGCYHLAVGLLFGTVAVVGMMTPMVFEEGIIYDGRSIILSLAGLFGGPLPAAAAAVMCAAYRLHLGGAGAPAGVAVIIEAAALGVGLHYLRRRDERWVGAWPLLGFGLLVHVLMMALQILLLPEGRGWTVLHSVGPYVLTLFPIAFLATSQLFLEGERRRRDEVSLAQSEERHRALFENNHAVMLVVDPATGRVVDANPAACAFYGWPRETLCAKHVADINTLDREQIAAEMNRARLSQRSHFFFQHRLADGRVRDVEIFSGPIRIDDRELLFSVVHDVTERRYAEDALAERERQLATLMNNLPGMAYRCRDDDSWTMLFVSGGAKALTGYPPEDLQNNERIAYADLIHPDDIAFVRRKTAEAVGESRPFVIEYRITDAAGAEKWVWEQGCAVALPDGETAIEGFIADITAHKLAEQRIEHLNRVLRAIRDVNQLIVREQTPETLIRDACRLVVEHRSYASALVVLTDPEGHPTAWAESGVGEAFGSLEEQLLRGELPGCCTRSAETDGAYLVVDRDAICGDCSIKKDCQGVDTLCMRLAHGTTTYGYIGVTVSHSLGLDEEERQLFEEMAGDLAYALNAMADRAALAKSEQDREEMQQQLLQAQKMEAVGQLAGGVAHDFNNILQGIMGYAHLLIDGAREKGESCEDLEEIYRGTERAAALTRQLLAFSRRQVMRPVSLDLNDLVSNLLNMLRRVIGEHIRLEWLPGSFLGAVLADAGMLEQAIMNLCVNARDAMPQGGTLAIETQNVRIDSQYCANHAWATPGRYVLLSVTDTGCGIAADIMDHIFEPFFTTKEEGKGTGLGLATVYGVVKQHKGMVNVYSESSKGTTFKIYLPVCEQRAETIGSMVEGAAAGGNEVVLLAEDDEMVRMLARKILTRAGYVVLLANDGEEAVEAFQENADSISLLVLDVVMPRLGGRKALDRIRAIRPDVPVLFTSGYSENAVHTGFVLHKGLRLVQKPYAPDALLRAVRETLDQTAREAQNYAFEPDGGNNGDE